MAAPVSGERFGKFVRTQKLGAGGMGEVWKAWDTELSRWVALKFLKGDDADEVARFRREAQVAAGLSHPNIAAIYEATDQYIAMQFVEGQTLRTVPRKDRRELARMVRDAARGVAHAHERDVVHRDLKPDNVMATPQGHVYVMDFGLARQVRGPSNLSVSGMMVGTPAYMAPEQARGERADARADVYGLGATLYELLADRPPFAGGDLLSVLTKVSEEEPKRLRRIDARIDADLETIVLKCLEKERDRRYATAGELADDLDRWLAGEAIAARPASTLYRLRKRLARRKAWVVAILGLGLAGIAVPVWLHEASRRRERERQLETTRLFLPMERDLDLLTMNFYRPDFRLSEAEIARFEELIGRVEAQMRRTGPSADGWTLIGRSREVIGAYRPADEAYARAMELDPHHAGALVARGKLALSRALRARLRSREREVERVADEARRGMEWVRRGAERSTAGRSMELDLARAYLSVVQEWEAGRPHSFDAELERWRGRPLVEEFALLAAFKRPPADAERRADALVAKAPSWWMAYLMRGTARHAKGDKAGALAEYDRALEINPRDGDALLMRANLHRIAGRHDVAERDYAAAIEQEPDYARAYYERSVLHRELKRAELARRDLDRAMELDPAWAQPAVDRAKLHAEAGRADEALRDYARAIDLSPGWALPLVNRGNVHQKAGRYAEAEQDYSRAIERDPKDAVAFNSRGALYLLLRRTADAERDLTRAIELDPKLAPAYYNRSQVYQDQKRTSLAEEDLTAVIALAPSYAAAYTNRGGIYLQQRRYADAERDFTRAIDLDPGVWQSWWGRGHARLGLERWAEAARDLEEAVRRNGSLESSLRGKIEEARRRAGEK